MAVVLLGLALAAPAAATDGNQLIAFSARMKARGGAGAASAQDAMWTVVNPAAIVDLEPRFDASLEFLYNRVAATPKGALILRNPLVDEMRDYNFVPIPAMAGVWNRGPWTFGAGIIGIQGDIVDFPRSRTLLSSFENADRRAAYEVARIPFAAAYKFDNGWALGLTLSAVSTRIRLDSLTLRLRPTRGDYEWDWAFGYGFQAGIYRNWGKWAIGASYTSPHWVQDFSKYDDILLWNLDLPEKVQAGIAFRPVSRLELVLDYKFIHWGDVNQLSKKTTESALVWRDQHIAKGGASYELTERLTTSLGFSIARSAVPDHGAFANILTPAVAEKHATLGLAYALRGGSEIALTYTRTFPNEVVDSGDGDLFSKLGRGSKISYEEHSLTAQYSFKF